MQKHSGYLSVSYLVVDDDPGIVLKIEKRTVLSPERFSLSYNDRRHDLLPKFGLALLDCR